MFMKLLARISNETLPLEITEPEDIHDLFILRAAGYLHATIPLPRYTVDGGWHRAPAEVLLITPYGHAVLRFIEMAGMTRSFMNRPASIAGLFKIDPSAFKTAPKKKPQRASPGIFATIPIHQ